MSRFDRQVVVDDNGKPLAGAVGQVYNINDTTHTTPLPLFTPTGSPISGNLLVANDDGVIPQFTTPGNPRVTWVSGAYSSDLIAWDAVPPGGNTGQVMTKASADDLDVTWSDPVTGMPGGGTTGQVLAKKSATAFDTQWVDSMVNVKSFGAKGDGTTDDRAAIQAALDLGGYIYFPQGDYRVGGTLYVRLDGTVLVGSGAGNRNGSSQPNSCTRLRATTGLSGVMLLVQRSLDDRPLANIQIMDMAFDGNSAAGPIDGIIFRASQSLITNVNIWQFSGVALRIRGYASPYWDTYDTRINNCLIGYNAVAGVLMDNNSPDLHFTNCIFLYNYDNMILLGGSSQQVTACHFYSGTRYNIWFNGSGSRSKFSNCKIEGAGQHQVLIDSTNGGYSDIQFTGCGFSTVDQAAATNTYDLVQIAGPSGVGVGRTTFVGNNFSLKGGSSIKNRFAINLASSNAQNTVIVGNTFGPASHWGTAPMNNAGSSSLLPYVRGNFGLPDLQLPVVKTTSHTADPADCDLPIEVNSATAVTVTIPPNAQPGFMKGNVLRYTQTGAGQVTIAPGAGVTIRTPRTLTTRAQWSTITLRQSATNTWILEGDAT